MTVDNQLRPGAGGQNAAAIDAAKLMAGAKTAGLGTIDRQTGHPYVSLVTLSVDAGGAPLMLLSRLARHTQNLEADPRASLLLTPQGASVADPMAGARVTLIGRALPTLSATARERFLARHPEAEMYAGFADFQFFGLIVDHAHFIGGFGRIVEVSAAEIDAVARRG